MKTVVSLNAGSSSIRFAVYTLDPARNLHLCVSGKIDGIGIAPHLAARTADHEIILDRHWPDGAALTHAALLEYLFGWATGYLEGHEVVAIGHRVVHGGMQFTTPRLVDDALLDALDALCPLAPLHQPHNLAAIRAIRRLQPDLPQIACFDTAFHRGKSELASRLSITRALHDEGIRRYGFHGLSYEYIARRLAEIDPALAKGRVIAAHLGNGASLCAMQDSKGIDTTMGFTTLDGLMMGTRCGGTDPGVVLHLLSEMDMTVAQVETLLYKQSGLLGVSGISSDMRVLSASAAPEAEEAIALFAWRAAREASALVASLGGLDGLIFTAGIGENDADVRRRICQRLEWLGLTIDERANADSALYISLPDSRVKVMVIPTDEEQMIAIHSLNIVGRRA